MRTSILVAAVAAALAAPAAMADRDDHDHHHDRGRGHAHGHDKHKAKEEFWDGNCKVKREWKHGEYRETRECRRPERVRVVPAQPAVIVPAQPAVIVPARPVVVPAQPVVVQQPTVVYPPWMVQQQGEYVYKPQYRPAHVSGTVRCNSSTVGSVLGGIVGGVLGNQIGKGDGRTLATIGGAVAGVIVGGEVGKRMDAADQACVGEVLEVAPVGRRVQWVQGQTTYVAVPGQVAYRQGAYCRPYTLETKVGPGRWQRTKGTACRRPDGVWIAG
ncbi:MAG TPA: glycine zipper 2TM domain-containing protein [Ramlibacter sp.]|uniref:glycine zipper 2TM domain-containing protein n=1 Tax=Ramlibacter sp. TaxID=1917967 RepID=UPI002D7F8FE6|nr:glycine zipper 2TM domain-containing protein [Ramlibacter sp.]HET8748606.1 glycine zipper 2TM domain-containing protein [Ramlibacter sp.]